mmetsp:Transcript_24908/g.55281  ORF Transcript_24908/g.55281 Transcript_24908/m.55281 type:complete len:136 (+) Transcript_24908:59-466(+)
MGGMCCAARDNKGPQKIWVTVHKASGLKRLNLSGDDNYCICDVVRQADSKDPAASCRTKAISKTLSPEWEQTFEVGPWSPGEQLKFSIYSKGVIKSKIQGTACLDGQKFHPTTFSGPLPIEGCENGQLWVSVCPK